MIADLLRSALGLVLKHNSECSRSRRRSLRESLEQSTSVVDRVWGGLAHICTVRAFDGYGCLGGGSREPCVRLGNTGRENGRAGRTARPRRGAVRERGRSKGPVPGAPTRGIACLSCRLAGEPAGTGP
jgi:hypothetical protein